MPQQVQPACHQRVPLGIASDSRHRVMPHGGADTSPLRAALSAAVWRHGRSLTRAELLARQGLAANGPQPYLAYLGAKFG